MFGLRKKNSIDMVIMVILGTEVRERRARGRVEESGVHGLLLYHHRSLSQVDRGEIRLLLLYARIHAQPMDTVSTPRVTGGVTVPYRHTDPRSTLSSSGDPSVISGVQPYS